MPLTNIYALCEPNERLPRYVGQTAFPLGSRLSNHIAGAKAGKSNPALSQWINDLRARGQKPGIVLLEECHPDNANAAEQAWIAVCIEGKCNLLNQVSLSPRCQTTRKPKRMNTIKTFLHERNMTQTELADKLGVQPSYVSMIISGDRAVSDAFRWRWMQVFGAEAVRVLNGDGHTQEAQP